MNLTRCCALRGARLLLLSAALASSAGAQTNFFTQESGLAQTAKDEDSPDIAVQEASDSARRVVTIWRYRQTDGSFDDVYSRISSDTGTNFASAVTPAGAVQAPATQGGPSVSVSTAGDVAAAFCDNRNVLGGGQITALVENPGADKETVLTDVGAAWTPGAFAGARLAFTSGALTGISIPISDNTATTLSIPMSLLLSNGAENGDTFMVLGLWWQVEDFHASGAVTAISEPTAARTVITDSNADYVGDDIGGATLRFMTGALAGQNFIIDDVEVDNNGFSQLVFEGDQLATAGAAVGDEYAMLLTWSPNANFTDLDAIPPNGISRQNNPEQTTITDAAAAWPNGALVGHTLLMTSGGEQGTVFDIQANTATTITISDLMNGVVSGDEFAIINPPASTYSVYCSVAPARRNDYTLDVKASDAANGPGVVVGTDVAVAQVNGAPELMVVWPQDTLPGLWFDRQRLTTGTMTAAIAEAGGDSTLTDANASYVAGGLVGSYLFFTSGPNVNLSYTIDANTATTIDCDYEEMAADGAGSTGTVGSVFENPAGPTISLLVDENQSWTEVSLVGSTLAMTSGAANGNTYTIDANDAVSLSLVGDTLVTDGVAAGDTFAIYDSYAVLGPFGVDVRVDDGGANVVAAPAIAARDIDGDDDADVFVVWQDDRNAPGGNTDVWFDFSTDGGVTWAADVQVSVAANAADPAVEITDVDADGTAEVLVAYEAGGDIHLRLSADGGASWLAEDQVNRGTGAAADPSVTACDSDGDGLLEVYVAWGEADGAFINYAFVDPTSAPPWSWQPTDLRMDPGTTAVPKGAPSVAANVAGKVYGVWEDRSDEDNSNVYFSHSADTTTQPQIASLPFIFPDSIGDGAVAVGWDTPVQNLDGTVLVDWKSMSIQTGNAGRGASYTEAATLSAPAYAYYHRTAVNDTVNFYKYIINDDAGGGSSTTEVTWATPHGVYTIPVGGLSAAGTPSTITDSSLSLTDGGLVGSNVVMESGAAVGTSYAITANTDTTITVNGNLSGDGVVVGDRYSIDNTDIPAAPVGLAADNTFTRQRLTWTASPEADVVKYRVYASQTAPGDPPDPLASRAFQEMMEVEHVAGQDPIYEVFDGSFAPTVGNTYYYRVTAVDGYENESDQSAELAVTVTAYDAWFPAAPTNVRIKAGSVGTSTVTVQWGPPATNNDGSPIGAIKSYSVYRASNRGGSYSRIGVNLDPDEFEYVDNSATNGIPNYYKVAAAGELNQTGLQSEAVWATPHSGADHTPPAAITTLQTAWLTSYRYLVWGAAADAVTYRIYVTRHEPGRTGGRTWTMWAWINASASPKYPTMGLELGVEYFWQVMALDAFNNESEPSNEISFTSVYNAQLLETSDSGRDSTCAVATACYGSPAAWQVEQLRMLRDSRLDRSALGRGFVDLYYAHCAAPAAYLGEHSRARAIVRLALRPAAVAARVVTEQ